MNWDVNETGIAGGSVLRDIIGPRMED